MRRDSSRSPKKRKTLLWIEELETRLLFSVTPERFIARVYDELLQRPPDPAGSAYWTGLLNGGASRIQMVLGIENSTEYRHLFVRHLYDAWLGRPAEPQGLQAWVQLLDRGSTGEQVRRGFLESPEYFAHAGGTNTSFLSALYHDVLDREMDPTGATGFGQALANGVSRGAVATAVLTSAEAARHDVQGFYQRFLHRAAEPAGLNAWVGMLTQGRETEQVLAGIIGSAEYLDRLSGSAPAGLGPLDPLCVLDAAKAVVVKPGVTEHDFSTWGVDLRAQVSGSTVSTYAWDLTNAPDATGISGQSSYRLQFTWASFTGTARTDTIKITATNTDSSQLTQTLTFLVAGTDSPAYTASPPTSSGTWPAVLPPDALKAEQETVGAGSVSASSCGCSSCGCGADAGAQTQGNSPYYRLGLNAGDLRISHGLPGYNPGVPPLRLLYNSTAANPLPVFIVHYPLDPSQAVPATVTAQLTLNGNAGQLFYYSTSGSSALNPGDIMEIALQGDATALSTGRYSYQIVVTPTGGTPTTYSGNVNLINSSSSPFGAGWSLDTLQRIWSVTGGALLELPGGYSLWFANGQTAGTFQTPAGDTSTLTQNTVNNTYQRLLKDGTTINFDANGRQTSLVDRNNNTTTFSYDGSGKLTAITDFNNLATTFTYSGSQVTAITDPANRTTTLAYTGAKLTTVTDPDNAGWSYGYDAATRLTSLTDARSNPTTFTYNFAGRVSTVTRPDTTTEQLTAMQMQGLVPNGSGTQGSPATPVLAAQALATYTDARSNTWSSNLDWLGFGRASQAQDPLADLTLTYRDANGLGWLVSDPLGRRTRSFFDGKANPTTVVLPDNNTQKYAYNGFSEVTQYTDPGNNLTTYSYDSNGNLTQVSNALNFRTTYTYTAQGFVKTVTDPRSNTTTYAYDTRSRLTTRTDALNHLATFGYDAASNRTLSTDERGNTTTFAYDPMGRLTQQVLPDSSPATYVYAYDAAGNRTSVTDPLGHVTSAGYDKLNRLTSTTDALNHTTTLAYDGTGNRTTSTDPLSHTTSYAYNKANLLTTVTDPLNKTITYAYDAAGQRTSITDPLNRTTSYSYTIRGWLSLVTDPLGNKTQYSYNAAGDRTALTRSGGGGGGPLSPQTDETTTYTYDSLHRNTQFSDPLNHPTTYGYDAANNRTSSTDALGHSTTFSYDSLNRLIRSTDSLGNSTSYGYDAVGNRITVTDPLLHTTTYAYDARNRLTSTTDARGGITTLSYDLASRETSITDPVNNVTQYAYDNADRLTTTTDPRNKLTTYSYDAANRQTSVTDRNGRQRTFGYDNANRRTSEVWLDGSGNSLRTITYNYDAAGQRTAESDPDSTYSYSHDLDGRLQSVDNNGTPGVPRVLLTYGYDAFDNRTTLTDNLNGAISYIYDAANRLTLASMTASSVQGPQITLAYDAANRLTGVTRSVPPGPSTVTSVVGYDNAERLTAITHSAGASTLASYSYSYDPASRLTSYTGPEGSLTYTYDNTDQLTNVGGARLETYTYDLNGNRTMTGYQTGTGNRLTSDGIYNYTSDNEGNVATQTRISDGQQSTFTWDYRNRLTQVVVKTSGGVTLTNDRFTYDVEDRRMGKSVNSGTTQWTVYEGAHPYADFNGSTLAYRYLYGKAADALFARFDGTNTTWYLTDRLGSIRQLAKTDGTILDTITYDSYGTVLNETGSGDRFKYTGREYDAELAIYYFRARYYGPAVGRFLSEDPLGFGAGDSDLYRYVHNHPTDFVDPSGKVLSSLCRADAGLLAAAGVGGGTVTITTTAPPIITAGGLATAGKLTLGAAGTVVAIDLISKIEVPKIQAGICVCTVYSTETEEVIFTSAGVTDLVGCAESQELLERQYPYDLVVCTYDGKKLA
jgi:RHS repeat-associated protein